MKRFFEVFFICQISLNAALGQETLYASQDNDASGTVACGERLVDAWSFTGNRALLGTANRWRAGIYGERKFLLPELSFFSAAVSAPTRHGGLGAELIHSGDAGFNETRLGLSYGRALGKKANLGIGFSYRRLSVAGHGGASGFSADVGLLGEPLAGWHIGLQVSGLPAGTLGKVNPEKPGARYTMQVGFDASEQVLLELLFYKQEGASPAASIAVHYQWNDQLFFGIGIDTGTASPFGRAGWQWKRLRILLAVHFHPVLGATPTLYLMTEGEKRTS